MAKLPAHRVRRRPPLFAPVPLRSRRDGWTVARQCQFLALLYATGSVAAAARGVGMAREAPHRLRVRAGAEDFARAWDHVLSPPGSGHTPRAKFDYRKVTVAALIAQVEAGLVQPVIYRGAMTAIRRKPHNSALFRLLRRLDAREARGNG
ncbi:MAG: hypothetical protein JY451_09045 [Erythrobacter sp.]|nr:MAG: hypothetical protein JY451_09045 [Erythrobacter sp.]